MGTVTVLQLPQVTGLTGAEQLELTQNGRSARATSAQVAQLAQSVVPIGPVGVLAVTVAGAYNDFNGGGSFGATTGFLEATLTANANFTGLQQGFDGQVVIITNLSAFALTLNALNNGSQAANQFRLPADLILTQNDSQAFKYSATIMKWVAL